MNADLSYPIQCSTIRTGQIRLARERPATQSSGPEARSDVEVFAERVDAERFAAENPGTRISERPVRRSVDEAVVIFDRRVVVAKGAAVLDRTNVVRRFIDDPLDRPESPDVEWFHDEDEAGWHIAGFGVDQRALDVKIQRAIDDLCRLSNLSAAERSVDRSS